VLAYPEGEGLRPAEDQVGVERRQEVPERVLLKGPDAARDVGVAGRYRVAGQVAVAVQVLRRAVDDDVGTEFEGALVVGRGERQGDEQPGAGLGDAEDGLDLGEGRADQRDVERRHERRCEDGDQDRRAPRDSGRPFGGRRRLGSTHGDLSVRFRPRAARRRLRGPGRRARSRRGRRSSGSESVRSIGPRPPSSRSRA